jgi:hypothetical protein
MYADRRPDGEDMAALRRERDGATAISPVESGLSWASHWQQSRRSVSSFAVVSSVFSVSGTNRQSCQQAQTIRLPLGDSRLGYGVCETRRNLGRDCSQDLTGKICVSELEPSNVNSATSKPRDLDQTNL